MTRIASNGKKGRSNWFIWIIFGLITLSVLIVSITIFFLSREVGEPDPLDVIFISPLVIILWAAVGGLILTRYPQHVVGWIILTLGLVQTLQSALFYVPPLLIRIGFLSPDDLLSRFFTWTNLWVWILYFMIPGIFLPLYFPSGTLPSPRWRIVSLAGAVGLAAATISSAIGPGNEEFGLNPFVIPGAETISGILLLIGAPLLIFSIFGALASIIVRYRRAQEIEREQIKWLFFPLAVYLIWLVYDLAAPSIWPDTLGQTGSDIGGTLIGITVPIAIGIAILRYRLYAIDLIIRRTLLYSFLTLTLGSIYFGTVVLLQSLFSGLIGSESPIAIIISTLAIVFLFRPLRNHLQRFIDRRFYRRKYNIAQTLNAFAATARDEVDMDNLADELLQIIEETIQPETIFLWLKR